MEMKGDLDTYDQGWASSAGSGGGGIGEGKMGRF